VQQTAQYTYLDQSGNPLAVSGAVTLLTRLAGGRPEPAIAGTLAGNVASAPWTPPAAGTWLVQFLTGGVYGEPLRVEVEGNVND
jgi:hypothetical protein